jgi:hypothetical protein
MDNTRARELEKRPSRRANHHDPPASWSVATVHPAETDSPDKRALGRHQRDDSCAGARSIHLATTDTRVLQFRCPRRIRLHQVNITSGWHGRSLSPFQSFSSNRVEVMGSETVFTSLMHLTSRVSPSRPRPASPANHNSTWLSVKFDFISELGLFQKHLWQAYTPRIANLNNATLHCEPPGLTL